MPRPSALPIAALAMAVALAGAPARAQEPAQGPRQAGERLTMSLDKVLPLLNTAVVRVRTPSEAQVAAGDATLEAARDGVATTHLTGIRVSNDLAIVSVPDVDPPPASYDVALFDGWLPAPMVATDDARLYALLRISGQREAAPTLAAAPDGARLRGRRRERRPDAGHPDGVARARREGRPPRRRRRLRHRTGASPA